MLQDMWLFLTNQSTQFKSSVIMLLWNLLMISASESSLTERDDGLDGPNRLEDYQARIVFVLFERYSQPLCPDLGPHLLC